MPYPGGNIIRVTPTLSESAYAEGDVLFNPTKIPNAVSSRGGASMLLAMYVIDYKDISDTDCRFVFTEKNTTDFGTLKATANISADNLKANNVIGTAFWDQDQTGTGAYVDNARIHQVLGASGAGEAATPLLMLKADGGSTDVYITGLLSSATTPTYDADSLELIFHIKYLD